MMLINSQFLLATPAIYIMMDREKEDLAYILETTYEATPEIGRMPAMKFDAYDDSLYWRRGEEVKCYAFDQELEDMLFRASEIEIFGVNI